MTEANGLPCPFDDYEAVAERLNKMGWRSSNDAQWEHLKEWCDEMKELWNRRVASDGLREREQPPRGKLVQPRDLQACAMRGLQTILDAIEKWLSKLDSEDLYRGWFLKTVLRSIIDDPRGWEENYAALAKAKEETP